MFVTPIIYPSSLIPTQWRWLVYLNPMSGLIENFRAVFLGRAFDYIGLGISTGVAISLFIVGIAYFEQVERRFADVI
jgi:lipopolysaccharide transport system permease protein